MKKKYFDYSIFGMICLTLYLGQSQNILLDGDYSGNPESFSFETATVPITTYFDKVVLQELSPFTTDKVVISGTFQSELNCGNDWDPNCVATELTYNSATGLYRGSFPIPAGNYRYKVSVGNSGEINYGENGKMNGADIFLCITSNSEETIFSYDPSTNLVTTSPNSSGFSPDCLPLVILVGSFQNALGCIRDWAADCENTALMYNSGTGLFEGEFLIPPGCYEYGIVLENSWQNRFGQEGIHNGPNYIISIPENPDITHFTYDPVSHIVSSTPYSGAPQKVTNVSLVGNLQNESGCAYDYDYECENPALIYNSNLDAWVGSFTLPAGCYIYRVKETFGCNVFYYGENGIEWGLEIPLYVPSGGEVTFTYDPQTHIINSTPYNSSSQEVLKVSLYGNLQDELGCAYDYEAECEDSAFIFNSKSGAWEGSFTLPAGCYAYRVIETFGCKIAVYGENGIERGAEIQIYHPSDGEITFIYDPQTHTITSTPYFDPPQEVTKVSLFGTLQSEFECVYDYNSLCNSPALQFNPESGAWEGIFTLPAGCYTYWVKETYGCNNISFYGEDGIEWGTEYQLYVPTDGEVKFIYDPKINIIITTPHYNTSTLYQCPNNISVNNEPGVCGAIVNYPEIVPTADCAGEIFSVTQIEGLPGGSFFPVGITTNSFLLTTTTGDEITCSFDVVVNDTESPVISGLSQSHETLWPPNHKMVPVFLDYSATDNCNISNTEVSITSNEPENGIGDGNTSPDWEILDEHNVLLRAERSGKGNGREYYINIMVTDESGNVTEQIVTFKVPHNNGKPTKSELNSKFILYPNGADDVINIKELKSTDSSFNPSSNSPYVIYDMLGMQKKQGTISNDQIEVSTLLTGVYILKFETDKGFVFKKFIKN